MQHRPTVERPQGRRADLPISIEPGFFVASLAPPLSERAPAGVLPRKLAKKKRRQSFLESISYVQSEKAQVSPLGAFATPGDSAMLESGPFRLPANCEKIRLRRCRWGSNAQVHANWAFLQILAQSPKMNHELPIYLTTPRMLLY